MEEQIQRQIIIADCLLYQSILTFINLDLRSVVKGGWLMRKSWKIYEKLYKELPQYCSFLTKYVSDNNLEFSPNLAEFDANLSLSPEELKNFPQSQSLAEDNSGTYDENVADLNNELREFDENNFGITSTIPDDDTPEDNKGIANNCGDGNAIENNSSCELTVEVGERLFGSVCFGYGAFQLSLSLLPPKILRLIQFLGFDGNRECGLKSLELCSHCKDMKAPFAT